MMNQLRTMHIKAYSLVPTPTSAPNFCWVTPSRPCMTELFDALTITGETISEEDHVEYLLGSFLPDTFNVLVTALEPKLKVITERILNFPSGKKNEREE